MTSFRSYLFSAKYEDMLIQFLRFSLAIIFIWFGFMKVAGFNSVFELVHYSMAPALESGFGLFVLGVVEVVVGVLLLAHRFLVFACIALALHLAGTFSTFIFGWGVVFNPHFPVLSLAGEFVVKNITLAISGLVVLVHEERKRRR